MARTSSLVYWKLLRRYRLTVRTEPSQGLNTGSIPVSATKPFRIICLQNGAGSCLYGAPVTGTAKARFQMELRDVAGAWSIVLRRLSSCWNPMPPCRQRLQSPEIALRSARPPEACRPAHGVRTLAICGLPVKPARSRRGNRWPGLPEMQKATKVGSRFRGVVPFSSLFFMRQTKYINCVCASGWIHSRSVPQDLWCHESVSRREGDVLTPVHRIGDHAVRH